MLQCVKNLSNYMKACTYIRIDSTYKRIVVRTYVWLSLLSGSLLTHWGKKSCTYRISVFGGNLF